MASKKTGTAGKGPKKSETAGTTPKQPTQKMEKIMTEGKNKFEKLTRETTSAGKEQMEALVESGTIWVKGTEDIVKTCTAMVQESVERNTQAFKTLLSSKTLNEYTEAQNTLAQQNFDDFMSGFTKLSELGVKLATNAFAPINDQFSKSIKKATDSLAA